MPDETALTTVATSEILSESHLSRQHVAILKNTVAVGTTDEELQLFLHVCRRTGLDPFARQIYAVKRAGKMTIQTAIDGFRLIAERTGKYSGQLGPFWAGSDLKWTEVWTAKEQPFVAKVGVLRSDFAEPLWSVAKWSEYAPGPGQDHMWRKMPAHMLAKVAEALALRRAFPQELSGLYGDDEMHAQTIEAEVVDRVVARVAGFRGVLQSALSREELTAKWDGAAAFRADIGNRDAEALDSLQALYESRLTDFDRPPAETPAQQQGNAALESRVCAFEAALKNTNTQAGVANAWKKASGLLDEIETAQDSKLMDRMTHAKEARLAELEAV
jgi:phage recombination protein Bet